MTTLAMIQTQSADGGLAFGDADVMGTVMADQHDVISDINAVLCKGSACADCGSGEHCHTGLHVCFACQWYTLRYQQGVADDQVRGNALIVVIQAFIVVSHGLRSVDHARDA